MISVNSSSQYSVGNALVTDENQFSGSAGQDRVAMPVYSGFEEEELLSE